MKKLSSKTDPQAKLENAEDAVVIDLQPSIGKLEVDRRLAHRTAAHEHIRSIWPLNHQVGYIHAFTLMVRTATMAALIGSHNPVDLAYALRVPQWSIRIALITLEASDWRDYTLPLLTGAMQFAESVDEITEIVDEFIEEHLGGDISYVDLFKAIGPCVPLVELE